MERRALATYDVRWPDIHMNPAEAARLGVRLAQLRPGERVDATEDLPTDDWWSEL